jgi:hypothetical protein
VRGSLRKQLVLWKLSSQSVTIAQRAGIPSNMAASQFSFIAVATALFLQVQFLAHYGVFASHRDVNTEARKWSSLQTSYQTSWLNLRNDIRSFRSDGHVHVIELETEM